MELGRWWAEYMADKHVAGRDGNITKDGTMWECGWDGDRRR